MKTEPNDIVELRRRVAKAKELSEFNHQIGFDNRGNHVLGAFLTGVLQEYDTLRAERDAVVNERTELCKTVAFFASVIKSGEPWSDTCQTMYDNTIKHLPSRK